MLRYTLSVLACGVLASTAQSQERMGSNRQNTAQETRPIQPARGVQGLQGAQPMHGAEGVGSRRSLPNKYEFRTNEAGGRRFEHSFDMTTDAQFRAHNIENVGSRLVGESLYNNPWYWQNVGSLDTELMTDGSGVALSVAGADGDYFNPYLYDQWNTTGGQRHSGAMTTEIGGIRNQFSSSFRRNAQETDAILPSVAQGGDLAHRTEQPGLLAADRSVLVGHRLHTTLQSDIDDTWSGRIQQPLGRGVDQDRQGLRYMGSGLRGLSIAPGQPGLYDAGLSSYDLARLRDDQLAGRAIPLVGQAWNTRFKDLSQNAEPIDTRMKQGGTPLPSTGGLHDAYQSMADRYASLHPASLSVDQRLDALDQDYRRLRGELITGPQWSSQYVAQGTKPQVPGGLTTNTTPVIDSQTGGTSEKPTETIEEKPSLAWEDYGLLLRHGQTINAFDVGDRGRFNDLVAAAEDRLAQQDYFWAERRFDRALRFIPGHPLATAGMGHAQVGASLYLSAALTLQSLLAFQPEMIDVQYGQQLLPAKEDLDRAISTLTDRIQGEADLDRYGFLLAYLGHQLDRQDLVQTGLDAMRRAGADSNFVQLLSEVWGAAPTLDVTVDPA